MKYHAITISGLICSGKSSLFNALRQELNWKSYSASDFFRKWCQEHNVPLFAAELRPVELTKKIDQQMRHEIERDGNIIVEGWLAGFMTQGIPGVFKILLVCEDAERIKRFAQRENVSLDQAKAEISKREASLFAKWRKVYSRNDFFKPDFYDLAIDTTQLKPNEVLEKVLKSLN
ncbi:cytidylate kinase family protein [Candidatus Microgenomates bacterium]|nr:cytidylate kinase family protein [Candidatus Microgenomates bacterium]